MYHIWCSNWLDDVRSFPITITPSITITPPTTRQGPDGFSPNPDFVSCVEDLFPDKSTKICVGCLSGKRSEAATAALEQAGYSELTDMTVGYNGWCQAGLPTTTS